MINIISLQNNQINIHLLLFISILNLITLIIHMLYSNKTNTLLWNTKEEILSDLLMPLELLHLMMKGISDCAFLSKEKSWMHEGATIPS